MSFEDIKGQDRQIKTLKEAITKGYIFSSYLFVGPDGIGKAKVAQNFAKALNCPDKNEPPCDTCVSCRKVDSKTHPDVFFIEPKGASFSIGIEQIRTVIAQANLKPYEAPRKVFVIDGAHAMNQEAANAFLKTLEEPPSNTIFILVSRSKESILPTIVSRCHVVRFSAVPREIVENMLIEIFSSGDNKMTGGEAEILSNFSAGRIGEAIRMREEGLIERKNRLIDTLIGDGKNLSGVIGVYKDKEDLKRNLEFLVSFFRDIFLSKTANEDVLYFNSDRIGEIKDQRDRFTLQGLESLIKKIITLRAYVDYNVNPKIIVDVVSNELRSQMRS